MKYKFTELIDARELLGLMQSFYEITGIQSSITDVNGNLVYVDDQQILGVGWQRICKDFHRKHPVTLQRCIDSDTILSKKMHQDENYACYCCKNGLWDIAVPIYIGDKHIVNLFTGQFFFEPPDLEYFKNQAIECGFNQEEYLKAVSEVPVIPQEKVDHGVKFLMNLARIIVQMGVNHKDLLELNEELEQRVEERTQHLINAQNQINTLGKLLPICANCKKIRNDDGYYEQIEKYFSQHSGLEFSHGICPECMKKLYPEFIKEKE